MSSFWRKSCIPPMETFSNQLQTRSRFACYSGYEDSIMTIKYRTAIQALILTFDFHQNCQIGFLSWSCNDWRTNFTFIRNMLSKYCFIGPALCWLLVIRCFIRKTNWYLSLFDISFSLRNCQQMSSTTHDLIRTHALVQ